MALDGLFLYKLANELNEKLVQSRIDSIDGINKTDYIFKCRKNGISYNLFLSVSYHNPTIFISEEKIEKPPIASNFTMYLRKYLEGGFIKNISTINNDRILVIDIIKKNDFDGEKENRIVLELIGRFSNLLIIDEDQAIKEAIKELSVIECPRGIMRGLIYTAPKNDKIPFNNYDEIEKHFMLPDLINAKEITNNISGISPLLASYLENEYKNNNLSFIDIYKNTINKYNPTLYNDDYYFFDCFKEGETYGSLSSLLEAHYIKCSKEKTLKDNNQEVYRVIKTNIKRIEKKIGKLNEDLKRSENSDMYRLYGELLLSNAHINTKSNFIKVLNYYDNTQIEIALDPKKSIKDNSQDYYKKYKKSKNAKEYIDREIDNSNKELEFFKEIEEQLKHASLKDILEIKQELIDNQYLKDKNKNVKKKKIKPNYLSFKVGESIIYVGKNNIQNNYLTHSIAKKDDYFFHVKDGHGSHVIVSGMDKDSEEVIRFAALKASQYSSLSDSTSVPVDYTLVKYLKKIPGVKGSKVTYTHNKTIYVDPKRDN